jgi:hypothetical protein
MSKFAMNVLEIAAVVVLSTISLNSCAERASADKPPELKMPENIRGMMMELMREEKIMLTRCSEGSARLAQATAIIAEGCDLEKEAQKLRAYAKTLNNSSSNKDQRKNITDGWNLVADVNQLIVSATNATVQSKEKFKLGYVRKCQAEQVLNRVIRREAIAATLKAQSIINTYKKNKDSLQSNPMAAVQMSMALNYALLPIRFVSEDYAKFQKERKKFDEQCQQIGKKYAIALPAPGMHNSQ